MFSCELFSSSVLEDRQTSPFKASICEETKKEFLVQKNAQAASGERLLPQAGDKTIQDVTYRKRQRRPRATSIHLKAGLCFVAVLEGFCIQTTNV